jgi:cytochrome c oxidase assembly factor CtaG
MTSAPCGDTIAAMAPDLSWTLSPVVLLAAALAAATYIRRFLHVRAASPQRAATDAPVWRLACFVGAILLALAALVSPLDSLADQLFAMHMVQHVLLLDLVPILAILGLGKVLLRPVTRVVHRVETRAGLLAHPVAAVILYVGVIWAWHIPAAYDLAVRHSGVHVIEHTTFLLAGSLYWWHLLSPIRSRLRLGGLGPVAYMVSTKLLVGALGMGLAFAPSALYAYYVHRPRVWSLSALDDQALAGIVMAVEQSVVMGIALVALFIRALAESERAEQRRERYELPA